MEKPAFPLTPCRCAANHSTTSSPRPIFSTRMFAPNSSVSSGTIGRGNVFSRLAQFADSFERHGCKIDLGKAVYLPYREAREGKEMRRHREAVPVNTEGLRKQARDRQGPDHVSQIRGPVEQQSANSYGRQGPTHTNHGWHFVRSQAGSTKFEEFLGRTGDRARHNRHAGFLAGLASDWLDPRALH